MAGRRQDDALSDHRRFHATSASEGAAALRSWTCHDLQRYSKEQDGFEQLGEGQRRRAWLWLLGLSQHESVLAKTESGNEEVTTSLEGHDAQTSWSPVGMSSRDGSEERDAGISYAGSQLLSGAEASSVPLDSEGWQIAGSSIDHESISAACGSNGRDVSADSSREIQPTLLASKPQPVDEWTTAVSRKQARRRRAVDRQSADDDEAMSVVGNGLIDADGRGRRHASEATVHVRNSKRRRRKHKNGYAAEHNASARSTPHRDEQQVELDVRRSFIELGDTPQRKSRREQLSFIIRGVLRRHPSLNYYQGYHDVVSVVLSVMLPDGTNVNIPEDDSSTASTDALEAVVAVVSRMSLHLLRDGMARDMTPTLGHLKLLRAIIVRCSAPYVSRYVDAAGPLPYFALPWLLSLFAHDVSPGIAFCIFDYILARGPVSTLCLAAALIETLTEDQGEQDPAEMHHELSQLPHTIRKDALPPLFDRADTIAGMIGFDHSRSENVSKTTAPSFGRQIMGPQSVLYTWRNVPSPSRGEKSSQEAWRKTDSTAAQVLSGDVSAIVINALPTPPPSPPLSEIQEGSTDVGKPSSRKSRRNARKDANGEAQLNARFAVLGAVGALGMAMLFYYGGSTVSSQASSAVGSNVLGRDAAMALMRSSDALRQLVRHALQ